MKRFIPGFKLTMKPIQIVIPVTAQLIVLFCIYNVVSGRSTPTSLDGVDTSKYYDTIELYTFAKSLQKFYPDIVEVYSIGESVKKRELLVIKISKDVSNRDLGEPMFKYVANMHGDETVGRHLMVNLAQFLTAQYGKDKTVTKLLNNTEIHLMPSMNPDGFELAKVSVITTF